MDELDRNLHLLLKVLVERRQEPEDACHGEEEQKDEKLPVDPTEQEVPCPVKEVAHFGIVW